MSDEWAEAGSGLGSRGFSFYLKRFGHVSYQYAILNIPDLVAYEKMNKYKI